MLSIFTLTHVVISVVGIFSVSHSETKLEIERNY